MPEFDFVIVGAGSAGCVLANRLSAGSERVLLLEAGPSDRRRAVRIPAGYQTLFHSELDWDYTTEPQSHLGSRRVSVPRGRTLGGSSSINAQVYLRGHRADFDHWAALGNPGWDFDSVAPYFDRMDGLGEGRSEPRPDGGQSLSVTRVRDPHPLAEAFVQSASAVGVPRNDNLNADLDGVGHVHVTQRRGARWSVADAYLRPALGRSNLEVATSAQATRVLLDGHRAVGVEYRRAGVVQRALASEVILCGGVVNSPQLLLLSGLGPAEHLRAHGIDVVKDLRGVGQNLQDHTATALAWSVHEPLPPALQSAMSWIRYVFSRRGRLASNLAEAAAFVRSDSTLPAPDVELLCMAPRLRPAFPTPRWAAARARELARTAIGRHRRAGPRLLAIGAILVQPRSIGSIELRSADPFAPVRIDPNYLSAPEDVRLLMSAVRLVRRIAASAPLSELARAEVMPGPEVQTDDEIETYLRAHTGSLEHLVGTCKMGTDDMAVVDPELRVRGVEGLRVVDASVIPWVTRGHMNAPTVMIAERASGLILAASPARAGVVSPGS